jgi:hypothetical protein
VFANFGLMDVCFFEEMDGLEDGLNRNGDPFHPYKCANPTDLVALKVFKFRRIDTF